MHLLLVILSYTCVLTMYIYSQRNLYVKHVLIFTGNIYKRLQFTGILQCNISYYCSTVSSEGERWSQEIIELLEYSYHAFVVST